MNEKIVYTYVVGDLLHIGHITYLETAKFYAGENGKLIVGVLTDEATMEKKSKPIIPFEERLKTIKSLKYVDLAIVQHTYSPLENVKQLKPDILIESSSHTEEAIEDAKKLVASYGGNVVILPYYKGQSSTSIKEKIRNTWNVNETYSSSTVLKEKNNPDIIAEKKYNVIVSAGDAITAKLVQEAGFDGVWVSGFEVSARLGLVDNGSITMSEMLNASKPIINAVNLPVYIDVDNGYGGIHNFIRCAREFEKIGAYAICVEDNPFPKTNSLWGGKTPLLSMEEHGQKIKMAKMFTNKIKIIARTEALVRKYGINEAIKRAEYYAECGADMILIHSRDEIGEEAREISKNYKINKPLAIVPTKFPQITNQELSDSGFSVIIWANQTERVKIKSVRDCLKILKSEGSAKTIEAGLSATLDDMRSLTPIKEEEEINNLSSQFLKGDITNEI